MRVRRDSGVKISASKYMASEDMPSRKFLYFGLSQIASGAISGT